MRVQRFVGENVHEAMKQVKQEMGSNAVILHTRAIKPSGLWKLFQKEKVEITAAIESSPINGPILEKKVTSNLDLNNVSNQIHQVQQMVSDMKYELESSQGMAGYSKSIQKLYQLLINQQVEPKYAKELVVQLINENKEIKDDDFVACQKGLLNNIEKMFNNVAPIEFNGNKPKIVTLFGPTGVGKTTTIAKLAAHFTILEKKKVGLITADTYRIAAVEQLKTYGDIIGTSVQVVFTASELKKSIDLFSDKDLILIDTAGRSHRNQLHMSELKNLLNPHQYAQAEQILVLSAIVKNEDLYEIIDNYGQEIDYNKIIFTKLDETKSVGSIFNVRRKTNKTLSYVTTGQNVPDDIELLNPNHIASRLVKGNES